MTVALAPEVKVFPAYQPYMETQNPVCILYGGGSSGKSYVAAQKHGLRMMSERNHRMLAVRKVAKYLKESCYEQMREVLMDAGLAHLFEWGKTPLSIRYPRNNSVMLFTGCDDVMKLKSFVGITSMWLEEPTELTPDDYDQLDIRMRKPFKYLKQQTLSFNPVSKRSWLYKRFFAQPSAAFKLHVTHKDNLFLEPADRQKLLDKEHTNPKYYQVYTLGQWGTAEGNIYPPLLEAPLPDPRHVRKTWYGMDFGFSESYTALIRFQEYQDIWYLTEMIYARGLTTSNIGNRLDELGVSKTDEIYADPSQPGTITDLWRQGWNIHGAKNAVEEGINAVREVHYKLRTNENNVKLNAELDTYSYKKDRDGNTLNDPVKDNDHAMDALRYGIYSVEKRGGGMTSEIW